ncbi:hypothetical protein ACROYT_G004672, partial [Oculina patagonica]
PGSINTQQVCKIFILYKSRQANKLRRSTSSIRLKYTVTMKDKAKLNFTTSEVQTFRALCDELERLQKQLQDDLKPEVPRRVIDYIQNLQFQELTKTTIDRTTDAGILSDDMQRFLRFATTVKMVNKSSCDDKIQNLSQQLESGLITISSLMRRVLRENSISPPHPQDFSGLKDRLDELTRSFLVREKKLKQNCAIYLTLCSFHINFTKVFLFFSRSASSKILTRKTQMVANSKNQTWMTSEITSLLRH